MINYDGIGILNLKEFIQPNLNYKKINANILNS